MTTRGWIAAAPRRRAVRSPRRLGLGRREADLLLLARACTVPRQPRAVLPDGADGLGGLPEARGGLGGQRGPAPVPREEGRGLAARRRQGYRAAARRLLVAAVGGVVVAALLSTGGRDRIRYSSPLLAFFLGVLRPAGLPGPVRGEGVVAPVQYRLVAPAGQEFARRANPSEAAPQPPDPWTRDAVLRDLDRAVLLPPRRQAQVLRRCRAGAALGPVDLRLLDVGYAR